jgi:hypothetical protein
MAENVDFPIKGWKWIFYTLGLTSGVLNPVFWASLYILHLKNDKDENFINNNFHVRVFRCGVITFIAAIVLLLLFFIFMWVLLKNISQFDMTQLI